MGVTASNVEQKKEEVRQLENLLERGGVISRHCDVCMLLDGDMRPKDVRYCKLCDKFMCEPCRKNPLRRASAATAYKIGQFLRSFKHGARSV